MTILTALWGYLVASFALMLAVKVWARGTGRQCRPLAAWDSAVLGVIWDKNSRKLAIFPLPMLGVVVNFGPVTRTRTLTVNHCVGRSVYRLNGEYIVHWYEDREGQHVINTIRALRAAVPGMTLKEAKELWDNRKAA